MNADEIARAASLLAGASHVCVLTGAGVSAESGVPTFRGQGGLWRGVDPMSLATPTAFRENPADVWEFYNYRRKLIREVQPNPAHFAIVQLASVVPKLTLVTQNVDCLHQRAGSRDVLELHGSLREVRCTGCGQTFDMPDAELPALPHCESCGAMLRPGVVWFGEMLPEAVWEAAEIAATDADVVLVVGTSALVRPAATLIGRSTDRGQKVIEVNPDATPYSDEVHVCLRSKAGETLPEVLKAMKS